MKLHIRMLAVPLSTYVVICDEINEPSRSLNATESQERECLGCHLQSLPRICWPEYDRQISKSRKVKCTAVRCAGNSPSTDYFLLLTINVFLSELRGPFVYGIITGKFEVDKWTKCVSSVSNTLFYSRRLSVLHPLIPSDFFPPCIAHPMQSH